MRTTRRIVRGGLVVAGALGTVAAVAPRSRPGRAVRKVADRLGRDVRYVAASTPGALYRLSGARPDPDATDDVVAERVRARLGPLERRLDVPRVRVAVEDHVATLHGDVGDERDAHAIEHAVARVSGVRGVESHLHAGLTTGDTRPSEGRSRPETSPQLHALVAAAREAGAVEGRGAVHAVLCGIVGRIPPDERDQLLTHLPPDVRALAGPARRHGTPASRLRTIAELLAAEVEEGLDAAKAEAVTRAVVGTLRSLVPEEVGDVAAVLPPELRSLWQTATAGA